MQLLFSVSTIGQTGFRSEDEMKITAASYFAADQFALAFPLYSQLLSLDPDNIELNYRFGVCLLYTDRANTEEPIKFLEKVINKVGEIDLYYHLATAYHNNYFFTDAIYNYRKYQQLARNSARKDYDVKRKIAMCQNGIDMLKAVDDLYVMQKSEVDRKAFYRSYDLNDFGGRMLNLPEEFLNKADIKNQDDKVTFFNPKASLLFYTLENKKQKDIYFRIRQLDGGWSDAIVLDAVINTEYDEASPLLMPDGKTLYFSSKGHNTMGGYDIFRSVYDSLAKTWTPPVNLSFPFNTPADDILFIPDKEENKAWFASNRNSNDEKITVYQVGIIKKDLKTKDLSEVYLKESLSTNDLDRIREMAQLNINISDKEFQEIPNQQKNKLDALTKNEARRLTQNIRQTNLQNIDNQLAVKEMQTGLNDSIKTVIAQVDAKLEYLKSLLLQTQGIINTKSGLAQKGYSSLEQILAKAQKTGLLERRKDLLNQANRQLFNTLRLDFQHAKLSSIETEINNQIAYQRKLLNNSNTIFGDIQKNIITRNEKEARKHINRLNQLIRSADTLVDYSKIVDYSTGNLYYPNYPSNLIDENTFAAYYIENETEYLAPISSTESKFLAHIPEQSQTPDLELLKSVESKTSAARANSKQYMFQLKLIENLIKEKKQITTLLLNDALKLVQDNATNPTEVSLEKINAKFAEARRAAYEAKQLKISYEELKIASEQSELIASELTELKSTIETYIEKGEDQQAFNLESRIEQLSAKDTQLPNYADTFNFETKEFINLIYPEAIKNVNTYVEFSIENGKLSKRDGKAFNFSSVDELIDKSNLMLTETASPIKLIVENKEDASINSEEKTAVIAQKEQKIIPSEQTNAFVDEQKEVPKIKSTPKSNLNQNQIREELANFNQNQSQRIQQLKLQSTLLTEKASQKLDSSNAALLEFEQMREQYNAGTITDQKAILAKQSLSQNLLYQSLAIKQFAEKTDSIYQSEQKLKEESTSQIFAIEQALQSNQLEKAQSLYRAISKTSSLPTEKVESAIQNWIASNVAGIPKQKEEATKAFENSQKLTDVSIQLLMESQELREDSKNKGNAFKRRELVREAEEKEKLGIQKQNEADAQLALGTDLYDQIRRSEAIQPIAAEFSESAMLALNTPPILNPEKRKTELSERLNNRDINPLESKAHSIVENSDPKLDLSKVPEMNDLVAYETKRFKAQLIAEELDINKRETVHLIQLGKTLTGAEAQSNDQKITSLRAEASTLQTASTEAFIAAQNIYNQLPQEDKNQADSNPNDFENYLRNVRNRIAQLLDDVTILGEQAGSTEDTESREELIRQADEKEQIAMYLILEEYEIIAQRNRQNYRKNSLIIEQLLASSLSQNEKDLMAAIFDQIDSFMQMAENKQQKTNNQELSFSLKKILLQDAFSNQSSALDLQLEAIRMMRAHDLESMLAYQPVEKQKQLENLIAAQQINKKPKTEQNRSIEQPIINKPEEKVNPIANTAQKNTQQIAKEIPIPQAKEEKRDAIVEKTIANKPKTEERIAEPIEKDAQLLSNTVNARNQETLQNRNTSQEATNQQTKIFPNVSIGRAPSGTEFSVQIAAIRGLRTTDNFLNVIELFTLKDNEKELYRYFSGRFTNLKAAIIRRNALRMQGYSDAFIKSWKEGQVVSMVEAAGTMDKETADLLNKTTIALPSQFRTINFSATNISQLNGVYYSVQVGVYSRPRSSAQLFGIAPLYHNRMDNGYWVYFNGIYKSIADADVNKINVRQKGVPDAFVVAFREGEKVSLSDARKAINQGKTAPADEDIIMLEDAAIVVDKQLETLVSPNVTPTASTKKEFRVQIGVFSTAISLDTIAAQLSTPYSHRVSYTISSTGKYIYTIGNFDTYDEAARFNDKEIKKLVKDSFIVAYKNGNKTNIAN